MPLQLANRMVVLVASMLVAIATSGQYAFAVYGGALKETLQLTQDDLGKLRSCRSNIDT